jgi:hypothetical protein
MAERRLPLAVRFNADRPSVTDVVTTTPTGKTSKYRLLSLPFYLVEELPRLTAEAALQKRNR